MITYILSEDRSKTGIEFVGHWCPGVWNVFYISDYDKADEFRTSQDAIESERIYDDRGDTYVATLKDFVLLFANECVYERFKRECPKHRCQARVASKRDAKRYAL